MEITRRYEFDAGHRVLGHEGKCRHIHGHRYVAEVTVESDQLDSVGRVVDFGVLKGKMAEFIDTNWDHNLLLNRDDPMALHLKTAGEREPFLFDGNPTAENIARVLYAQLSSVFGVPLVRVRIYETPNCWADYSR